MEHQEQQRVLHDHLNKTTLLARYDEKTQTMSLCDDETRPDPTCFELKFLNEGAANVVFQLCIPSNTTDNPSALPKPTADFITNHLLRLKKDVPWGGRSYEELDDAYHRIFGRLFSPEEVVEHQMISITASLVEAFNANLRQLESTKVRKVKRWGRYLLAPQTGMGTVHAQLITNMSSHGENVRQERETVTIELKPKWLLQSPTAPSNAIRCRTCALRAMRSAKAQKNGDHHDDRGAFCPLSLASGRIEELRPILHEVVEAQWPKDLQPNPKLQNLLTSRLEHYFLTTGLLLLRKLQALQEQLDPHGILATHSVTEEFCTAMTIRDCTLFLRVSLGEIVADGQLEVEGRLGDLDLKSPEGGKGEQWMGLERELIEGGYYGGSEEVGGLREGDVCFLVKGKGVMSCYEAQVQLEQLG